MAHSRLAVNLWQVNASIHLLLWSQRQLTGFEEKKRPVNSQVTTVLGLRFYEDHLLLCKTSFTQSSVSYD